MFAYIPTDPKNIGDLTENKTFINFGLIICVLLRLTFWP